MKKPRRVVASLLVILAAAFGACSGDDDEETTPNGSSVESPDTSARLTVTTSDVGQITNTTGRPG